MKNIRTSSVAIVAIALAGLAFPGYAEADMPAPAVSSADQAASQIVITGYNDPDTLFAQPYVDVDEMRETPVPHRYVHGGFSGTDTRFSYYFPVPGQYDGRFFQHVTPFPISENLASAMPADEFNKVGFAVDSGAYFVETNGGGSFDLSKGSLALQDPTITAYRANAAAARFSRFAARQVYDSDVRPYGYIYGGSGGAYRTIGSVENTDGVWDGAVPYVPGSLMAIPNMFTVRLQALRVLRDKFPQIIDAMEPGGSGDPYAGLTEYEASVLREIDRMGFPMESWFGYRNMGLHGFVALYGGVKAADPTYFQDFWTKPGYLGHDRPELLEQDRIQFGSRIAELITAEKAARLGLSTDRSRREEQGGVDNAFKGPPEEANKIIAIRLSDTPPPAYMLGGEIVMGSGNASGETVMANTLHGDIVKLGVVSPELLEKLSVGDQVTVDNSNFLAMESYHRHQVPGPDFPVWDQFRDAEGKPLYPQRPFLLGPSFVESTSGSKMTGKVDEKMIIAASLWDREAMPWQADWYKQRVAAHHDGDADSHVRLYYTDHALHGDEPGSEDHNRLVSYEPTLQQSLRDVAAWVEDGTPPPAGTTYDIDDGQVEVPSDADARRGIQPVVTLSVDGKDRIDIKAGTTMTFEGSVAVSDGAGLIVDALWDFTGDGQFVKAMGLGAPSASKTIRGTHRFAEPGTYFVALKGVAQRDGDTQTIYTRIENLGRLRVVVH